MSDAKNKRNLQNAQSPINVIKLRRFVPSPTGLLSVHKSGEENETGSIIDRVGSIGF